MAARDKPLSVKFVATEGLVWQGEVVSVLVRTTEGDIGIWSGALKPGQGARLTRAPFIPKSPVGPNMSAGPGGPRIDL